MLLRAVPSFLFWLFDELVTEKERESGGRREGMREGVNNDERQPVGGGGQTLFNSRLSHKH